MSDDIDYRIFYDDETYLLDVGELIPGERNTGSCGLLHDARVEGEQSEELPPIMLKPAIQKLI